MTSHDFNPLRSLVNTPALASYNFDLKAPTCSRRRWQVSRVPCAYTPKEEYCDDCFLLKNLIVKPPRQRTQVERHSDVFTGEGKEMKCGRSGSYSHNKRTCKEPTQLFNLMYCTKMSNLLYYRSIILSYISLYYMQNHYFQLSC